jgi:hypothetical protein
MNELLLLLLIGILAGFISGALGVGGGIIIVPALVFVLGMTQHQAQGTSLAVLSVPIGMWVATYNYHKEGVVNYKVALIVVIAFIAGSYLGSLMSVNLPARTLKKVFGVLMLVAGVKMIFGK